VEPAACTHLTTAWVRAWGPEQHWQSYDSTTRGGKELSLLIFGLFKFLCKYQAAGASILGGNDTLRHWNFRGRWRNIAWKFV